MIYVITFDPIKNFIDWAHQNDLQTLSFVKATNVVVKKMARNGRTIFRIGKSKANKRTGSIKLVKGGNV